MEAERNVSDSFEPLLAPPSTRVRTLLDRRPWLQRFSRSYPSRVQQPFKLVDLLDERRLTEEIERKRARRTSPPLLLRAMQLNQTPFKLNCFQAINTRLPPPVQPSSP